MKILIGYDVIISYLNKQSYIEGTKILFDWIDKIKARKCIDIGSVTVLTHFMRREDFKFFHRFDIIKEVPPKDILFNALNQSGFSSPNINALLLQLNLLFLKRVDYLVSDNTTCHSLAKVMRIDDLVYTVEEFIERCNIENDTIGNEATEIQVVPFRTLKLSDSFFDTFKEEYEPYYTQWFKKKGNDWVYTIFDDKKRLRGLLKLKIEDCNEDYSDINPVLSPSIRLKVCSFKADYTGRKLGQKFMRLVFDQALKSKVDEIYVTIVKRGTHRFRLIKMIEEWGFILFGKKQDKELVFVRSMQKRTNIIPMLQYPYINSSRTTHLVLLDNSYAELLFPSIVTDCGLNFNQAAIKKVVSIQFNHDEIKERDNLVFFKISSEKNSGNVVAMGIVDGVYSHFISAKAYKQRFRKRSTLSDFSIDTLWNSSSSQILVDFLYNCRVSDCELTYEKLNDLGIDMKMFFLNRFQTLTRNQAISLFKSMIDEQNYIIY